MKKVFLILIVGIYGCSERTPERNLQSVSKPAISNYNDTIIDIMRQSMSVDTFEYYNWEPLISFKSGNLFSREKKNAIVIQHLKDTINVIKLYTLSNNTWILNDSLVDSSGIYPQNYFEFMDYDFDNFNDIYINCSSSNGYSIRRGILLTVDPKTHNLTNHKETRNFGNMNPDVKSKTIQSEEVIYCPPAETANDRDICIITHKWVKGQLKESGKKCPCEQSN